jgi:predicted SnoaL-like aldol condensation-catalyzing enzyme
VLAVDRDGMSYTDAADLLGVHLNKLKTDLLRGRRALHDDYIQHNPAFKKYADERGISYKEGFLERMTELMAGGGRGAGANADVPPPPPNDPYELVIAEGDTVTVIQKRYVQDPNEAPGTYYESFWFDTFRVRDGLLYEHWDGALIN